MATKEKRKVQKRFDYEKAWWIHSETGEEWEFDPKPRAPSANRIIGLYLDLVMKLKDGENVCQKDIVKGCKGGIRLSGVQRHLRLWRKKVVEAGGEVPKLPLNRRAIRLKAKKNQKNAYDPTKLDAHYIEMLGLTDKLDD